MGRHNVSCDFGGGGRGERTIVRQDWLWRSQKVRFIWSVPVPLRVQGRWQGVDKWGEGGKHIIDGAGVQSRFLGEGSYGMFFPLLSFPPPFVFLSDLCSFLV